MMAFMASQCWMQPQQWRRLCSLRVTDGRSSDFVELVAHLAGFELGSFVTLAQ